MKLMTYPYSFGTPHQVLKGVANTDHISGRRSRSKLRGDGVQVDDNVMEDENGKFGWRWDLEGNKVELWEPPPGR